MERAIKTYKAIFFRLLARYPTENYSNILKICQVIYNNKTHRGIYFFTPHRVHHDTNIASTVMRKNLRIYEDHERESRNMFQSLAKDQKLSLGDKVRLRRRKSLISKESEIFYPRVSTEIYTIEKIKREKFPYLYILKGLNKQFYAFQLLKSNELTINNSTQKNSTKHTTLPPTQKIKIINAVAKNDKQTRTGRSYGKQIVYEISINDKKEFVDTQTLLLYKKLFSNAIFEYDNTFYLNPELKKLIV